MRQTSFSQNALNRMKGTLCFSSNFSAVIFVRDTDSDSTPVNWNSLTDANTFAEFKRFFEVKSARVEITFYVDANAKDVARWLEQNDTTRSSAPGESSVPNEYQSYSSSRDEVSDITSAG